MDTTIGGPKVPLLSHEDEIKAPRKALIGGLFDILWTKMRSNNL